jgi:hypothetical protein
VVVVDLEVLVALVDMADAVDTVDMVDMVDTVDMVDLVDMADMVLVEHSSPPFHMATMISRTWAMDMDFPIRCKIK